MRSHVEADWVPLPEWAAEIAASFARLLLLGLLRAAVFVFFRAVAGVVIISMSAIVVMVRRILSLPFISAAAAAATTMAALTTSTHVQLTCIVRYIIVLLRETANG